MTRREVYKFLSGFLAGAGVVHANIGFARWTPAIGIPRCRLAL